MVCRKHIIIHRDLKPANIMLGGLPADIWDRGLAQRYGTAKIAGGRCVSCCGNLHLPRWLGQ